MDARIENVYVDSEEMFREITAKIGMRRSKHWIWVYLALALCYIFIILPLGGFVAWVMFAVIIAYIIRILTFPASRAKNYIKSTKEYYNGTVPQTVVRFGEEEITVICGNNTGTVPYDKIDTAYFLKHSIVLRAGKMASVTLSTTGFTKGSIPELRSLLKEKCPLLKLPG